MKPNVPPQGASGDSKRETRKGDWREQKRSRSEPKGNQSTIRDLSEAKKKLKGRKRDPKRTKRKLRGSRWVATGKPKSSQRLPRKPGNRKESRTKYKNEPKGTKKQPTGNKMEPNAPERKLKGSQGKPKGVNKELKGS